MQAGASGNSLTVLAHSQTVLHHRYHHYMTNSNPKLRLAERVLLKLFCYPPPGRIYRPELDDPSYQAQSEVNPLETLARDFGADVVQAIESKAYLDIGCGRGELILALARNGAANATGVDIRPIYEETLKTAADEKLGEVVHFTTKPLSELPEASFDEILSRDSFEHYEDPEAILRDVKRLLKPGGRLRVQFGPTWYHPHGVHMFFMFNRPWPHLFFSEKTIMNVRSLYKDDGAKRFGEVEGGLNQMTVGRFARISRESGLEIERLQPLPIKGLKPLVWFPGIRELFTSVVRATLRRTS